MIIENKSYILIKRYPGSPALGTVLQDNVLGDFPEFWERKHTDILGYKDSDPDKVKRLTDQLVIRTGYTVASLAVSPFIVQHIQIIQSNPSWCMLYSEAPDDQGSFCSTTSSVNLQDVVRIDDNALAVTDYVVPATSLLPFHKFWEIIRESHIPTIMNYITYKRICALAKIAR